jgi:hypothetical protein
MSLAPGSTFGRFQVLRRLGAGAMGEVYLAEDPQIERLVAIKTVRVDPAGQLVDEGLRSRLAREAKAAGQLVHPHVVTLFEAGELDGTLFLAFEYVEGCDLDTRRRQPPPLRVDEVIRIAREAASGLAAVHRRGIVHRDVKPSNLLLDLEGKLKVTDFGIARLGEGSTSHTAAGSVVGTPQYLSPEQVRGEPLDGRSDLFALGVVLYELLAGRPPFAGDTIGALVFEILHREPPPLGEAAPGVPPRLAAAVDRLLAKDRDQRFPSAEALVEELAGIERERAEARHASTLALTRDVAAPRAEATVSRRRWLAAAAGLVAVVVLGTGAPMAARWLRAVLDDDPTIANELQEGSGRTEVDTRSDSSTADESEAERQLATPQPLDPEPARRRVATAVTFAIAPPEAAERAVVKVDGLVRGPAAGSLVTLRPGPHRLEIVAEGFEPLTVEVEAGAGTDAPGRLELTLRASAGPAGR